jgi:succinoglycan biosynthesis protein ExoM
MRKVFTSTDSCACITVCVCTYKREALLLRLLQALDRQSSDGSFALSRIVVIDNDPEQSASNGILQYNRERTLPVQYDVEPMRNIAQVRNRALGNVTSDYVAFIDDDEVPCHDWLLHLFKAMKTFQADAVFGPVVPDYDGDPPAWIVRSRICERPSYVTGTTLSWQQTRTGNVLFRSAIFYKSHIQFDPEYACGGEDVDFFRRVYLAGKKLVWCNEAPVYELVTKPRMRRTYHLKRALLQGAISRKYASANNSFAGTMKVAAKALAAIAAYTFALPFLFLLGEHIGMKYLIKDCHHAARLLAIIGVYRVSVRNL